MKPKFFFIFILVLLSLSTYQPINLSPVHAALSCNSCHGYPPSYASAPNKMNSHPVHQSYSCETCHIEVTTGPYTITFATNHVNGTYNVWGVNFTTYNFNVNGSSCTTNSACHGGQAYWGGPKKTCYDCHFGTADTDNYNFGDGFMAKISSATEYWVTGHGRSSTTFYDSKNRGAGIDPWRVTVSTADYCLYCHKKEGTSHGDSANFFRLRYSTNATCLDCHASPTSPGVNPGAGFTNVNASTKVATPHWGVKHGSETAANLWDGGKYCWDCHDPHGDYDLYGSTLGYMIQRFPVQLSSDTVPGVPAVVASTGTRFWSGVTAPSTYSYTDYVTTAPAMFGGRYVGACNVCHDASVKYFSMNASTPTHYRSADPRCTSCHSHNDNFKGSGECATCHSSAQGPRRAIVADCTTTANWGHFRANYAQTTIVTSTDCAVCHMEGEPSNGSMTSWHSEKSTTVGATTYAGMIQLRNPDTNAMIQFSTWNGRIAGVAGSTWTTPGENYRDWPGNYTGYMYEVNSGSFSFVKFSRSTGTAALEPWVTSVQNNHCLKCHDDDGAASASTWGQSYDSPFVGTGTVIYGSTPTIYAQFSPDNASYHPIRAAGYNNYCSTKSMVAPWGVIKSTATSVLTSTSTYDFSTGTGTNKWATVFYNLGNFTVPSSTRPPREGTGGYSCWDFSATTYTYIASSDTQRAIFNASASSQAVAIRHIFTINENISDIAKTTFTFVGYGNQGTSSSTYTSWYWNFTQNKWVFLSTNTSMSDVIRSTSPPVSADQYLVADSTGNHLYLLTFVKASTFSVATINENYISVTTRKDQTIGLNSGNLISCWDCHLDTTPVAGVRPWTHGGGRTSLRAAYNAPAQAAATRTELCIVCHSTSVYSGATVANMSGKTAFDGGTVNASHYTSDNTDHGSGRAGFPGGCRTCHGSGATSGTTVSDTASRRIRAEDAHGFNKLTSGASTWSSGAKPWGFIRDTRQMSNWRPRSGPGFPTGTPTCYDPDCGVLAGDHAATQTYTPGGSY